MSSNPNESGFSLVELLVAMLVTLIISGAVYGLLASGQSAFRREPELSERQQNIRSAMDMIVRDVSAAGLGATRFAQIFRNANSDGGTTGSPVGTGGTNTDEIEVVTDNVGAPAQAVCGSTGTTLTLTDTTTNVTANQVVLVFLSNGLWTARQVTAVAAGTGPCGAVLTIGVGSGATVGGAFNPAGGVCAAFGAGNAVIGNALTDAAGCIVSHISTGELVGYRIRNTNGVPFLERRSSRSTQDAGSGNAWDQAWQQMVPGIEDLQVGYQNVGTGVTGPSVAETFVATPGVITFAATPVAADFNRLIRRVQVTLWSRSEAANLPGMSANALGNFVRGQLSSTVTLSSTLEILSKNTVASGLPLYR